MSEPLDKWINSHVKKFSKMDQDEIYFKQFFREEPRYIVRDPEAFFSPADGIIINQKICKPIEKLVEVKGVKYTLHDVVMNKELLKNDQTYYVIDIFMTAYDVHVNRIPTDGYLDYEKLDSITSYNMPMIFMEKSLFDGKLSFANSEYLLNNERMLNTVYSPKLGLKYFVVQIADADVDNITPFTVEQEEYFNQGDRFSFIRWGSQCTLIVPTSKKYDLDFVQKKTSHVKAGIDKLLTIKER